jgi:hypothetical protein
MSFKHNTGSTKRSSKKPAISTDVSAEHTEETLDFSSVVSADLMRRICLAIDEWAKCYNLENMPRQVVFGQVLSMLTQMHREMSRRNGVVP